METKMPNLGKEAVRQAEVLAHQYNKKELALGMFLLITGIEKQKVFDVLEATKSLRGEK